MNNWKKVLLFLVVLTISLMGIYTYKRATLKRQERINKINVETNVDLTNTDTAKYTVYDGEFELPINGATGYVSVKTALKTSNDITSEDITTLSPGTGFTIIEENNNWWKISVDNKIGYVQHKYCLINLPDVIPSIIYNNTNAYSSRMVSSGYDIDNITNKQLYDTYFYNYRLKENTFVVPVLYHTAKKINKAQQEALKNGETLIIYEAYRPYDTQRNIVKNVKELAKKNEKVSKYIQTNTWHMTWFISTKISNHQRGLAIDVSLGKVNKLSEKVVGKYLVKYVSNYEEYSMPTPIHELSTRSTRYTSPVPSGSKTAWKKATYSAAMKNNEYAIRLEKYCTNAGLTPLASEWWHYNDLDCLKEKTGTGNYNIKSVYSVVPNE